MLQAINSFGLLFVEREKNRRDLNELGISPNIQKEILLNLMPSDYVSGPEVDRDRRDNEIWVFGTTVDESLIYVKLAFVEKHQVCFCKCLSFHKAQFPLEFPLKEGE